ncbi:hypothetical protein SH579_05205 [Raoultella ornithinolytica]|uniref:hypothetical protein n=1 Tax=Raoultella ornithinolytica TaxID=54291 RepID=UPI002A5A3A4B|nr:hypothetical protein [Raoultella ornithinolytica]WPO20338.1 hypothetical protein SH579_05205 [Raoultella ornithinolytica]
MITFDPSIGLKDYIKDELKRYGHKYNEKLPWEDNLLVVYSFQRKIPNAKPRIVIELPDIKVPPHLLKGYKGLKEKISKGLPLRGHLSKNTSKFKFHDLLLNYWNIHHFHLSVEKDSNGYFERTGFILFGIVFDNAIIFIDILNHPTAQNGGWYNIELIEKIHEYIPEVISKFRSKHVTGHTLTSLERSTLHKKHANYAMKLSDGSTYHFMGVMSSGDSFFDTHKLMHLKWTIDNFKIYIENENQKIKLALNEPHENIELTVSIDEDKPFIYSPLHKTAINFVS